MRRHGVGSNVPLERVRLLLRLLLALVGRGAAHPLDVDREHGFWEGTSRPLGWAAGIQEGRLSVCLCGLDWNRVSEKGSS